MPPVEAEIGDEVHIGGMRRNAAESGRQDRQSGKSGQYSHVGTPRLRREHRCLARGTGTSRMDSLYLERVDAREEAGCGQCRGTSNFHAVSRLNCQKMQQYASSRNDGPWSKASCFQRGYVRDCRHDETEAGEQFDIRNEGATIAAAARF